MDKTLVIDESTWLHGESGSCLYRSDDGKMCCMGFYLNQFYELTKEQMSEQYSPSSMLDVIDIPELINDKSELDNPMSVYLMNVNDDKVITEKERKKKIRDGFKKIGVKVRFIKSFRRPSFVYA